eukprot:scaffold546406_cov17-Prasinocladus_malaysianus.AAC.1
MWRLKSVVCRAQSWRRRFAGRHGTAMPVVARPERMFVTFLAPRIMPPARRFLLFGRCRLGLGELAEHATRSSSQLVVSAGSFGGGRILGPIFG